MAKFDNKVNAIEFIINADIEDTRFYNIETPKYSDQITHEPVEKEQEIEKIDTNKFASIDVVGFKSLKECTSISQIRESIYELGTKYDEVVDLVNKQQKEIKELQDMAQSYKVTSKLIRGKQWDGISQADITRR